jgi:hypothetical protein
MDTRDTATAPKRPNHVSHVSRSGDPGIVSLYGILPCDALLILLSLFTQEGDQDCRSVIYFYVIQLKSIEQRTNSS